MVFFVEKRVKYRGISSSKTGDEEYAGLRIVQQIYEGYSNNVVVKNGLRSLTTTSLIIKSDFISESSSSNNVDAEDYCFLGSCRLCKTRLCPDKDVYMYRGDQGFCSIECRNRQIMLDEMKERKARTRIRAFAMNSPMDCRGCETCKLLEELRRRKPHHRDQHLQQRPILSIA